MKRNVSVFSVLFVLFAFAIFGAESFPSPDIAWEKFYDFGGRDWIFGIQEREGGYLLAANFSRPTERGAQSGILIVSVDSSGDSLWAKAYFSEENEYTSLIGSEMRADTTESQYIITGYSRDGSGSTLQRGYILKLNSTGEKLWEDFFFESVEYDYRFVSFVVLGDRYLVWGDETAQGQSSPLIVEYTNSGKLFNYDIYQNGLSSVTSIALSSENERIVFGTYKREGAGLLLPCMYNLQTDEMKILSGLGSAASVTFISLDKSGEYFCLFKRDYTAQSVVKIDKNGAVLWSKPVSENLFPRSAATKDGGCVIAAVSVSLEDTLNIILERILPDGEILWTKSVKGEKSANAVVQTRDGGYVVGGIFNPGQSSDSYLLRLEPERPVSRRGDVNMDKRVDISDAITVLGYLFMGTRAACIEADEVTSDSQINITDAIYLLGFLFRGEFPGPEGYVSCQ